jgi:large exoprotein involved in heme utilization and adhesion
VVTNQPVSNVDRFFFPAASTANNITNSPGSVINIDVNNVRIIKRDRVIPPIRRDLTTSTTALPNTKKIGLLGDRERVAQSCEAGENKLTATGRGGLPTNANEPLGGDVVWRDPRTIGNQNTAKISDAEAKLPPPAIGWAMDSQGRIALLAAKSGVAPIGLKVSCPPQ